MRFASQHAQKSDQAKPTSMRMRSGCQFSTTVFSEIVASAETTRKSSDAPPMRLICPLSTSASRRDARSRPWRTSPPTMQSGKSGIDSTTRISRTESGRHAPQATSSAFSP